MDMIPQGYELYAVESDGTAYAVAGWDGGGRPLLVPLDPAHSRGAHVPISGQVFRFTTVVPGIPAEPMRDADLRERLSRLAANMELRERYQDAAGMIREELAR